MLQLRFGLEDGHARTLEEVSKEFNVTRERIRQIEVKALCNLRHPSRSVPHPQVMAGRRVQELAERDTPGRYPFPMPLPITIDLGRIRMPTGSDDEMTFHTFRGYLEATCAWASDLYPHSDGLVAGVAAAVKARPWRDERPSGKALSPRAGQILRNGWATEVLLNAPRSLGGDDLVSFANLWAPVQAYYAVFNAFTALAHLVTPNPPQTHAKLLTWAATAAGGVRTPFVVPWTTRVAGAPGAWSYLDFGRAVIDPKISNLVAPHAGNAPSLLAMALRTTRAEQVRDHREGWLAALPKTRAGTRRKTMPGAALHDNTMNMRPTTLYDLLWRLRVRSNYKEGDAFLSGALSPADAADFHNALCDIVAATMVTVEIFLAHHVGSAALAACAKAAPIPPTLRGPSVFGRTHLW